MPVKPWAVREGSSTDITCCEGDLAGGVFYSEPDQPEVAIQVCYLASKAPEMYNLLAEFKLGRIDISKLIADASLLAGEIKPNITLLEQP